MAMQLNQILAKNLERLMKNRPGLDTQMKIHKATQVTDPVTGEIEIPGLTQSTVQRVLKAKVHVTIDTLQRLADAFGVSPTDLLTLEEDGKPNRSYSIFASRIALLFDTLPKDQQTQSMAFIACHTALSGVQQQLAQQTPEPTPTVKSKKVNG